MDKVEFLANNVEADGKRVYEVDGMRVVFPTDWDDDKRAEYIEKARNDLLLRRRLRMIKKDGTKSLLRAFRQNT